MRSPCQAALVLSLFPFSSLFLFSACGPQPAKPAAPAAAAEGASNGAAVVAGTAPSGSIVALLPAAGEAPMPEGPAVMDQYSKTFVPNVLYVRVGQPVEFRNSEDMPHNVNVTRRGTGGAVFGVATEPQQKYVHTFDRAGQYDVACDIHPGMQALVVAAASSLVTIADEQGAFSIPNVPPGSYKVAVTFEGRTVERPLDVKGPRTEVKMKRRIFRPASLTLQRGPSIVRRMNKGRVPAHRRGPAVRPPGRTSPRALSGHEVRNLNRHLLLSLIRARQPISRADLARQTGLQRSTVSLITGTLIRQRWVTEGATGQSRQGRKPTLLYLNVDRARILGIDIRPALTTMAIADPNGRVIAQELFPTAQDPVVFVRDLCRRLRAFVKAHPEIAFEGLGITVPGRIDQQRQRLVLAPNLGWRNVDLKTPIESALGIPVEMENAANACALAEASFGVHGGVRDLIAVTVSEGIGTGIISDGRLLRGAAGMAGEFGHVCLDERGPLCKCGQRGCWEVFASNAAAVADYLRSTADHGRLPGAKPGPRPSFEDLLVLAQQGDRRAVEALERMARYLGDGIAMLATGLAPSRILVVGEITRAWDRVGPIVLERAAAKSSGAPPHILPAGDGGLARLRGTVALVLQKHFGAALVA